LNNYSVAREANSANHFAMTLPTREFYFKGPGMIFRGNAIQCLTEIQIPIREAGNGTQEVEVTVAGRLGPRWSECCHRPSHHKIGGAR